MGAPANCWLLYLIYICFVLNNYYSDSIKGVPIHMATGTTNDISPLLSFEFYEPIYYHMDDMPFPSASKEYCGHWVGISKNDGNFMTYKVLTDDTLKVIHHLNICLACVPTSKNLCHAPLMMTHPKLLSPYPISILMPLFLPCQLMGRLFCLCPIMTMKTALIWL